MTAVLPGTGAFVLAEYLEERFGGDEAIRWTWDRIGDGVFGIRPLDAIDDYVQSQGSTYPEAIEQFRLWNYVLSDNSGNIGYSDPDADPDEIWRAALQPLGGESYRRVTDTTSVEPVAGGVGDHPITGVAEGSTQTSASNTAYVEIAKPAGASGIARFTITRPPRGHDGTSLTSVRASIIPVSEYPDLCGDALEFSLVGDDQLEGSLYVPAGCSILTLAITNTDKGSGIKYLHWSMTFEQWSAVLGNGVIDLGVRRGGSMISDGVGVRLAGRAETDVLSPGCSCAAWGIADGTISGWVDSNAGYTSDGALDLTGFTTDGQSAVIDSALDQSLDVRLRYHPSVSSYLYAIDVQVERTATKPTSGRVLFDAALDFDVPPYVFHETVTWNSPTGQVPAFVDFLGRNGFHNGDPLEQPWNIGGPVVLGEPYGSEDQGTFVRLDLGDLDVGDTVTFTMYVGVAPDPYVAAAAIDAVGPAVYAYVEPGVGPTVPGAVIGVFGVSSVARHSTSPGPGPEPM